MRVTVLLRIRQGNFADGFSMFVQLTDQSGAALGNERPAMLPEALDVQRCYALWQPSYEKLEHTRALQAVEGNITNISAESFEKKIKECKDATKELRDAVKAWFSAPAFEVLRHWITNQVGMRSPNPDASIPIMIDANTGNLEIDVQLCKLPWHLWGLFDDLATAEPSLTAAIDPRPIALTNPVKILAIFGSDEGGLDLSHDQQLLQSLEQLGAEIKPLTQPSLKELSQELRSYRCDILFFAGHSFSGGGCQPGLLQIQPGWTVPIDGLRPDLQAAIRNGLKLAIFNSCDALGISRYLAELRLPSTIIMREPVPDQVAREFLKCFLEEFSAGTPLYSAVRQARSRITWMENDRIPYPAASWLPIVCQNPNQPELVWETVVKAANEPPEIDPPEIPRPEIPIKKIALAVGAAALLLVGGIAIKNSWFRSSQSTVEQSTPIGQPVDGIRSRLSLGERILLGNTPDKLAGSEAFKKEDYRTAISKFDASLQKQPNDPEALIYVNNAKANVDKNRPPIRIAVAVPILSNSNVAAEMLRGVAQAQDQINSTGGINSTLVEVVIASDNNEKDTAKESATALVNDEKVKAVIGHNSSEASLEAAGIYNNRLVMISPTSFSDELIGKGDYIFRTTPSIAPMATRLAEYMKQQGKTTIAVCYDSRSPDSVTFRDQLGAQGLTIVPLVCNLAVPTFNPEATIQEANAKNATALVIIPQIDRLIKATDLANANLSQGNRLTLFSSQTMYTYDTLKEGGEAVNGLVMSAPWQPQEASNPLFAQGASRWGGQVNWRTASSYDATMAVFRGLQTDQSRQGLQKALRTPGFFAIGASEEVRFKSNGERSNQVPHLIQVQKRARSQSGTGYDFVGLN